MGYINKAGNYYEGDRAQGDRAADAGEQAAHDAMVAAAMSQQAADAQDKADAKADAVTQTLVANTPLENFQYVRNQVGAHDATNLAELKASVVTLQNIVGKLAAVVGVDIRSRLR